MAKKGKVLMLHGWAQNSFIMRLRTKKLEKKLNQAGYECVFLSAPNVLPPILQNSEDVLSEQPESGATKKDNEGKSGVRKNARAWFLYSKENHSDTSASLIEKPMKYYGVDDSFALVESILQEEENKVSAPSEDFWSVLGFSQGAVFCHLLSQRIHELSMLSKPLSGHNSDPEEDEKRQRCPLRRIKCAIMVGGFPSMHRPEIQPFDTQDCDIIDKPIDLHSLHIFGEKDTRVPLNYGEKLASCFSGAVTYVHPKGHLIPQDSKTCKEVINFLDSIRNQISVPVYSK